MATTLEDMVLDPTNNPYTTGTVGDNSWGDILGNAFKGILSNLGTVASTGAGLGAVTSAYNRLGSIGEQALTGAGEIASAGLGQSAFKPFTVSTGMGDVISVGEGGTTSISPGTDIGSQLLGVASQRFSGGPYGSDILGEGGRAAIAAGQAGLGATPFGLAGQQQAAQSAFGLGQQFMGQAGVPQETQQQIMYNRLRGMQTGEEERQRLQLEERLANQGRLGVRTAMFGGTPEQLTLSKAQESAKNQAALMAIELAQQEQRQAADIGATYGQLGSNIATQRQALEAAQQAMAMGAMQGGMGLMTGGLGLEQGQQQLGLSALQSAYLPQAAMLSALSPAINIASLADVARRQQGEYNLEAALANLQGQVGQRAGLASLYSGMFGGAGGLLSGVTGAATSIFDTLFG